MNNRTHTIETRHKMSEAQRQRWANMSDEERNAIRRKMSDTKLKKENALKWLKLYRGLINQYMKIENKEREPFFKNIPKMRIDSSPMFAIG